MRVGWGYAHSNIIKKLYQVKKPFNVNRLGSSAAIESLKNKKWLKKNALLNKNNKRFVVSNISNKKFKIIDTLANFILIKCKSIKMTDLLILSSYGLTNYIRMTIGTTEEMKKVVKVFNKF